MIVIIVIFDSNKRNDYVIQWFRTFSLLFFANIFVTFSNFRKGTPAGNRIYRENIAWYSDEYFREIFVSTRFLIEYSIMFSERIALIDVKVELGKVDGKIVCK